MIDNMYISQTIRDTLNIYNHFISHLFYKGQTCYKRTEKEMEWDEARRQCWLWGGELAFPLPNQHCTVVSYATETEEVINRN